MVTFLSRPFLIGLLPVVLMACVSSETTVAEQETAVPLGIDLGGSGPVAVTEIRHASPPHSSGEMQMAHAG